MPAGSLSKLKTAILYGADAVYAGTPDLSLRTQSSFTLEELMEGVRFVHDHGKRIYLTLNLFTHNRDIEKLPKFIVTVRKVKPDGLIVSDQGVFHYIREHAPELELHVSTQANACSWLTVESWRKQGASLCVLAREVSFQELREIRQKCPDIKLEAFIHGAMCMAYSGRCLISDVMTGRNANLGDCAQSCRWEYRLHEEKRPGEYFPVFEEGKQSFIMNSRDLNLIRHIPDLVRSGIDSLKIEGRMKGLYYVSAVTRVYRDALDTYRENPEEYTFKESWEEELTKTSHRGFTTGFTIPGKDGSLQESENGGYIQGYDFVGIVTKREKDGDIVIEARNKINLGDRLEWIGPGMKSFVSELNELRDENGLPLSSVNPQQQFRTRSEHPVTPGFLLRRKSI